MNNKAELEATLNRWIDNAHRRNATILRELAEEALPANAEDRAGQLAENYSLIRGWTQVLMLL